MVRVSSRQIMLLPTTRRWSGVIPVTGVSTSASDRHRCHRQRQPVELVEFESETGRDQEPEEQTGGASVRL